MRRDEAPEECANAPDGEHDWIETTSLQDKGRRFVCRWCSIETFDPMRNLGHSISTNPPR